MPKKLTVLGALAAAVVLGSFGLFRDSGVTYAGPGPAVQNFAGNANVCYGTAPSSGPGEQPLCAAGTDTSATPGSSLEWNVATLNYGSRIALPIFFIPGDSSGSLTANTDGFGIIAGANGTSTGKVTAKVDIGCDASANDVLATSTGQGTIGSWPNGWTGFDLNRSFPPEGYVKHPFNWTIVDNTKAVLDTLWNAETLPILIVPDPIPLNVATGTSPYKTGLRSTVAQLGGDVSAPGGFQCLDSPQDTSTDNNANKVPSTAGVYARWTIYTAALDVRTPDTYTRVIDTECVNVGGVGIPASCTTDGDGDGVVAAVETASGTSDAASDQDGDLSLDGDEMFNGTRPTTTSNGAGACALVGATAINISKGAGSVLEYTEPSITSAFNNSQDTDCDGQKDKRDLGADEAVSKGTIEDTNVDDNCPADYNPSQLNSDSPRFAPNPQPVENDASDPDQDIFGDPCDADDDNDDMDDVVEVDLGVNPAPAANTSYCAAPAGGSFVANNSGPQDSDSDDDGGLDGRECRFGKNPKDALVRMGAGFVAAEGVGTPPTGTDGQKLYFRVYGINDPAGGGLENNAIDGDGNSPKSPGTDTDSDTDATNGKVDSLLDSTEVKFFGTRASSDDSDADGCGDGAEDADVTGNRNIDVIDLGQVAAAAGNIRNGGGMLDQTKVNRDVNRSGGIDVIDLGFVASHVQNCPVQGGLSQSTPPIAQ